MKLPEFKLETFLGKWEFKAPYLFCNSDMEGLTLKELLFMGDSESLSVWDKLSLGYTEDQGMPALLKEISELYSGIDESNILTFAGAEEGIYCTLHALLSPQDHVIVISPCYQSHESIPASIGCQISEVSLDEEHGWTLNLSKVKKVIQKNTKLIAINFPHNPTGVILDRETLDGLVQLARTHGIRIFSDEVYRLLEHDEKHRMSPLVNIYENGISLGVMSKAFALAGLRIGWIASKDKELLKRAKEIKHYLSICNSAPSEALALLALRAKDTILNRNHEIMRKNLALLDEFFQSHQEIIQWTRPQGGCVGFPKLFINTSIEEFSSKLLNECGVLIMPASIYGLSSNHFRIGFGRKNMPEALNLFQSFLNKELKG
jgi:aspartate/methionine/tyrosine aminotransferase